MDHQTIINNIQQLSHSKYIKNNVRIEIINFLNVISEKCSQINKQSIEEFKKIINEKIVSNTMISLNNLKVIIIQIINSYIGEKNEKNDNLIVQKTQLNNKKKEEEYLLEDDDVCKDNIIEIEELLDNNIYDYNKYNNNNPMVGVHYTPSSGKYRVVVNDFKTNIKRLNDACNKVLEKIEYKNSIVDGKNVLKKSFKYKNKIFIIYQVNKEILFDIQHIISIININKSAAFNKYKIFSRNIECAFWQRNKYNGYILRELISESVMYELIMSSSSEFSKSFKQDVSNILVKLRSKNLLLINNNTLQLNDSLDKHAVDNNENNQIILKNESNMNNANNIIFKHTNSHKLLCYDSIEDISYAKNLVRNGSNIILTKFINKNVIYLILLPIKTNNNLIIIKFGFTDNIVNRLKTLKDEYKCNVYLLDVRFVNTKNEEENFHILLHRKYLDCVLNYSLLGKQKNELYILSHNIVMEFQNLNIPLNENQKNEKYIDSNDESSLFVKKQFAIFSNFIEENLYLNNRLKYDYLIIVENNSHEKYMAELQLKNNILKYNNIDKEIALINAQIELTKLQRLNGSKKST